MYYWASTKLLFDEDARGTVIQFKWTEIVEYAPKLLLILIVQYDTQNNK